jgi:hypothetical protein
VSPARRKVEFADETLRGAQVTLVARAPHFAIGLLRRVVRPVVARPGGNFPRENVELVFVAVAEVFTNVVVAVAEPVMFGPAQELTLEAFHAGRAHRAPDNGERPVRHRASVPWLVGLVTAVLPTLVGLGLTGLKLIGLGLAGLELAELALSNVLQDELHLLGPGHPGSEVLCRVFARPAVCAAHWRGRALHRGGLFVAFCLRRLRPSRPSRRLVSSGRFNFAARRSCVSGIRAAAGPSASIRGGRACGAAQRPPI